MGCRHALGGVQYSAVEHLDRARHSEATFEQHYKRAAPTRVLRHFQRMPAAEALRYNADDVLFV